MSIHDHPYGVGLAYRFCLHEEVFHYSNEIDLLEVPTVDHIIRRRALSYPDAEKKFSDILQSFPCLAHGITMSIGSVEPLDKKGLEATRRFLDESGICVFSDHLAFQRMDGKDISSFLGMPHTDDSLDWLENNYRQASELIGTPFALENISLGYQVPGAQYSEPEFLREFLNRTDATLLLDVTNMFNNCTNFKMDPIEFLHTLPADRISQIHLAGGHFDETGFLCDCHGYQVMDEVWELYREALKYTSANIVILERDYRYSPFREVIQDVRKAREIFYELRPESAAESSGHAVNVGGRHFEASEYTSPEFLNLRSFQRAILRTITDDSFRSQASSDKVVITSEFPMDDPWVDRFVGCENLDQKAESWKETERFDREDEERLRRWEWSQWAKQDSSDQSTDSPSKSNDHSATPNAS